MESQIGSFVFVMVFYLIHIEKFWQNVISYSVRGFAKSQLKQPEDAIKDFDKAIELNPNDEDSVRGRSLAKGKLKTKKI